jgi:hypothetical protein
MQDMFIKVMSYMDIIESYRVALCSKWLMECWEEGILRDICMSDVIAAKSWSLLKKYPCMIINDVPNLCHVACAKGYIPVLEWMLLMKKRISQTAIDICAKFGSLETIRWFQLNVPDCFSLRALEIAAEANQFAVVKHLHNTTFATLCTRSIDAASRGGNIDIVRWLDNMRPEECSVMAMNNAAERGHLDILEFLVKHRKEGCTHEAMDKAALQGRLDVLHWLVTHNVRNASHKAMDHAAANGFLDILKYLYKKLHLRASEEGLELAALSGHIEVVKWLIGHDMPCNLLVAFACAVDGEHHDVARFLREVMFSSKYLSGM